MSILKRAAVAAVFAGAAAVPSAASAAPVVVTGGLVNVTVVDLISLEQTSVSVPISVAANVCDVSVIALATDLQDGRADCSTESEQITVTSQPRRR
jgi:hypothetical protein